MNSSRCRGRCWRSCHALRASVRRRLVYGWRCETLAYEAVTNSLMPLCVEAVLANPAAVAELKVKRLSDYDDVVRDHLKTIGTYKTDLTFWRACGKLLEGKVERTASN